MQFAPRNTRPTLAAALQNAGMTDVNLASSQTASPLAAALAEQMPGVTLTPWLGALTPVELDARAVEIEALVAGAGVHDLGWRRRVSLRGEDSLRWLSGMVTNTVKDLPENGGAWNLVLNAQGRIQGDLVVWRDGDKLELEVAADQYERLVGHLDRFIIMDDVEMTPVGGMTAIGVSGPQADRILSVLGLPVPGVMTQEQAEWNGQSVTVRAEYGTLARHYALWAHPDQAVALFAAARAAGARPVGSAALDALRIAEGIPAYGTDIAERDLPQETSQMRALHFNKGCYLGQEIVERIRSRGNVHRHLRLLELDGEAPPAGTELRQNESPVGTITSAAALPLASGRRVFALAMVREEAEVRNQPLHYVIEQTQVSARILPEPPTFSAQ